jgi:hypothetical protein
MIAHLAQHPAWGEFQVLAKEKKAKAFNRITNDLMRGAPIKDTEVAFTRGFFSGMEFLLKTPGLEDAKLERALADERKEVNTV